MTYAPRNTPASFIYSTLRLVSGLALVALLVLPATGCGKRGNPAAKDPAKTFSWQYASASSANGCLAITGNLTGAYANLDEIRLEMAPVNGPEDCPGCPFVAKEVLYFTPGEAGFKPDTGDISLSYCPPKAAAYRWRLIGISIFNRLPHAVYPVQNTPMEAKQR